MRRFNRACAAVLAEWGVVQGCHDMVARSNACAEAPPPAEPGSHAFSPVVPDAAVAPQLVVAGKGEASDADEVEIRHASDTATLRTTTGLSAPGRAERRLST